MRFTLEIVEIAARHVTKLKIVTNAHDIIENKDWVVSYLLHGNVRIYEEQPLRIDIPTIRSTLYKQVDNISCWDGLNCSYF